MDRREAENTSEICNLCGEEVDLLDPSSYARVKGRTFCRSCSHRLGGAYDPAGESWTREPRLPEALEPRED